MNNNKEAFIATFALGAGNLVEVEIVEQDGTTNDDRDLMYEVPSGFYAELVSFSVEHENTFQSGLNRVDIYKRVTSISDTLNAGAFLTTMDGSFTGSNDYVPEGLDDIYNYAAASNPDATMALSTYLLIYAKNRGMILFPGDEIRYSHNGFGGNEDWKFRATLFIYKNP